MCKNHKTTHPADQTDCIDLSITEPPIFTSRRKGIACREKYDLDKLDYQINPVKIIFPKNTYTMSSGFFLGLFGKSIRLLGKKERFLEHYTFTVPTQIMSKINKYINTALRKKRPLLEG